MRILLDTNIVLDILLKRAPFYQDSFDAVKKALSQGDHLYFSCSAVTDVYYLLHKATSSKDVSLIYLKRILSLVHLAEVNGNCIYQALQSNLLDYEDAVMEAVAKNINASYILTRNEKDFAFSSSKALSPKSYLAI